MKKFNLLLLGLPLLFLLQSCLIKQGPNMDFLTSSSLDADAEIVSLNVPQLMVKSFIAKEAKASNDKALNALSKNIKGVKVMILNQANNSAVVRQDFRNFLKKEKMEEYASIISGGDRVSINGLIEKDRVTKLMLGISSNGGEHIFVEIKGKFTMKEIADAIEVYE